MTGELDETYLSALTAEAKAETENQSLFEFTDDEAKDETTVAVVTEPGETDIDNVCDEFIPELGMPKRALTAFHKKRAQMGDPQGVRAHNAAFEACNLDTRYRRHVEQDGPRQEVEWLAARLRAGENITLVCFEAPPKECHRYVLKDVLEEEIEDN